MIADPQQALYRQFHLKRMSPLGVLSPAVAIKGMAAMARGSGIGKPVGDILQLPGVFIIDSSGRIVCSCPGFSLSTQAAGSFSAISRPDRPIMQTLMQF